MITTGFMHLLSGVQKNLAGQLSGLGGRCSYRNRPHKEIHQMGPSVFEANARAIHTHEYPGTWRDFATILT